MKNYDSMRYLLVLVLIGVAYVFIARKQNPELMDSTPPHMKPLNETPKKEEETRIWTTAGLIYAEEANEKIFRPLGYELIENTTIPKLKFKDPPKCSEVFKEWLAGSASQNESAPPPRDIPEGLVKQFTLDGYAKLVDGYMDNRSGTREVTFTKEDVDKFLKTEVKDVDNYAGEGAVYQAMMTYGVKDQSGIVIGSLTPWVESFAIRLGAAKIMTIEYSKTKTPVEYPWMSYEHPVNIAKNYERYLGSFDFAATFSSIEHSGLGRFGDALDPMGDIKESLKVYCMLKEGGLFFLGMPMGTDAVYWNLHRIYGRLRLPIMAAGFDVIDMFYMDNRVLITPKWFLEKDGGQPVIVLRKRYLSSISRA